MRPLPAAASLGPAPVAADHASQRSVLWPDLSIAGSRSWRPYQIFIVPITGYPADLLERIVQGHQPVLLCFLPFGLTFPILTLQFLLPFSRGGVTEPAGSEAIGGPTE